MNLRMCFTLFLVCFSFTVSFAQIDSLQGDPRVEAILGRLQDRLGLDEQQSAAVEESLIETAAQLDEIRPTKAANPQAFRQQKRRIMSEFNQNLMAQLNDDQVAELNAMRQEKQANRQGRRGRQGASPSGAATKKPNETLQRSVDFLFEEILTPTARKYTQPPRENNN